MIDLGTLTSHELTWQQNRRETRNAIEHVLKAAAAAATQNAQKVRRPQFLGSHAHFQVHSCL